MTKRRLPAEERRKQLLAVAVQVFARSGYHGATTREIAKEAQVAEALLYRHFTSKEELFASAVRWTSRRLVIQLEETLKEHGDVPQVAIHKLLGFSSALLTKNDDLAKMVFIVSAELDNPTVRDAYLPWQERALECVESYIRRWKHDGLISDALPERAAAWLILGSFQVIALMKHVGKLDDVGMRQAAGLISAFASPPRAAPDDPSADPASAASDTP